LKFTKYLFIQYLLCKDIALGAGGEFHRLKKICAPKAGRGNTANCNILGERGGSSRWWERCKACFDFERLLKTDTWTLAQGCRICEGGICLYVSSQRFTSVSSNKLGNSLGIKYAWNTIP
jgi:hypothetical protein